MFGKKKEILVDVMKCEHCSKRVHDGLKKIEGVKSVKVDLSSKKVTITYKDELNMEEVREIILNLGFQLLED